ncbi:hypothetical protein ACP70R_042059 [Stipagrostis hirtigluma subsp. patula]
MSSRVGAFFRGLRRLMFRVGVAILLFSIWMYVVVAGSIYVWRSRSNEMGQVWGGTKAVEANHRWMSSPGADRVSCKWRALPPQELYRECRDRGIWTKENGANVGEVLEVIRDQLGGVPCTDERPTNPPVQEDLEGGVPNPARLPLHSFEAHEVGSGARLSNESMADLLDRHGPCVGTLCVCPWYHHFDADLDEDAVYRGCGRSEAVWLWSKRLFGDKKVKLHAVVIMGYRIYGDKMDLEVMDNHNPTGPRRWVDFEELDMLYTLMV